MVHRKAHPTGCLLVVAVLALAASAPVHSAMVTLDATDIALIQDPEVLTEIRFLVRFELPTHVMAGDAELAILEFGAVVSCPDGVGGLTLDAYAVTGSWDSQSVVWSGGWETPGGDFDRSLHSVWSVGEGEAQPIRFDVTHIVHGWTRGESTNHGVIVTAAPGESGTFRPRALVHGGGAPAQLTIWFTPRR
jgi:hypothetical protein